MAANPPDVKKALFYTLKSDGTTGVSVPVHFNPASLVYSLETVAPQTSGDTKAHQYAGQFTGKLTMDLIFDTTSTGDDVRKTTNQLAALLQPAKPESGTAPGSQGATATKAKADPPVAPAVVIFEWGLYTFKGMIESFRETIDFFSAEGVPLRAAVSVGMARQDLVFDDTATTSGKSNVNGSIVPTPNSGSVSGMAALGGNAGAARQLAFDNGLESLRFTGGASLQVSGGVQLNPAPAFASSTSTAASGGLGLSLGVSAGASMVTGVTSAPSSTGASVSVGAASGAIFGSAASMGVPATMGAFAGLQTGRSKVSSTASLDPGQMLQATSGANVSTYSGASFSLGGSGNNRSGAGLSANVGATLSISSVLTFDNDD
jgi:hypothetical protein